MGYDNRCFAAALLGLGARGFLRIRQTGESFGVERIADEVDWLPGEKLLADWLLPKKNAIQILSKGYDPAVAVARESFAAGLAQHFGQQLFSRNRGSLVAGIVSGLGRRRPPLEERNGHRLEIARRYEVGLRDTVRDRILGVHPLDREARMIS